MNLFSFSKNPKKISKAEEKPIPDYKKYMITSSASDYVSSLGKNLSDYQLEGIYGNNLEDFIHRAENRKAIAVVDFRPAYEVFYANSVLRYFGTALIPKNKL
nr:hypothetical protein [Candidatus Woesearchaeota archaeon]